MCKHEDALNKHEVFVFLTKSAASQNGSGIKLRMNTWVSRALG